MQFNSHGDDARSSLQYKRQKKEDVPHASETADGGGGNEMDCGVPATSEYKCVVGDADSSSVNGTPTTTHGKRTATSSAASSTALPIELEMTRRRDAARAAVPTNLKGSKKKTPILGKKWEANDLLRLKNLVAQHGTSNWDTVAPHFPLRSLGECRDRWYTVLDPSLKRGGWTPAEDSTILKMASAIGNRWARISKCLPGRTPNSVKNRNFAIKSSCTSADLKNRTSRLHAAAAAPDVAPTELLPQKRPPVAAAIARRGRQRTSALQTARTITPVPVKDALLLSPSCPLRSSPSDASNLPVSSCDRSTPPSCTDYTIQLC
eukprot:CAMPEP_0194300668 /NCGR_PEP_ID=MMETSP0169-20130528/61383_1 /TAXON_ID=218684 /ORGANISM="Corethron pennatum, Strain L29A3" /LENGTH=319 /DNA_ID=CAMNT_0039050861 /DNA_START=57 /DNA_END=1016 /DNA_ORIENTATION=+